MAQQVQLNFDNVKEIANKGVRRTAVFLGIAVNAASTKPPLSHVIEEDFNYQFLPTHVTSEEAENFVGEYLNWTIGCAFRDLIEVFSTFFLVAYRLVYTAKLGALWTDEARRELKKVSQASLHERAVYLYDLIEANREHLHFLLTLKNARNCLAHRHGIVGASDVNTDQNSMELVWRSLDVVATEPDGNRVKLSEPFREFSFPGGATIELEFWEKRKSFAISEPLILSRRDLQEICFTMYQLTSRVIQDCIQYCENLGIKRVDDDKR